MSKIRINNGCVGGGTGFYAGKNRYLISIVWRIWYTNVYRSLPVSLSLPLLIHLTSIAVVVVYSPSPSIFLPISSFPWVNTKMLLRMRKGVGHGEKEETLSSLLFNPLSRSLFLPARLFKNNVGTRAFFFPGGSSSCLFLHWQIQNAHSSHTRSLRKEKW